jgi:hypothetical protein
MPASRRTKIIVWVFVGALAVGIAWFAHGFYRAWHKFASEDRFCGAFHPVITGIDQYHETTGTLPTNLTQLIPAYVAQIPTAPVADSVEYRVLSDGTNWQLTVHSRITGAPRVFVQRSSRQFTEDERRQSVTGFHGWVVFKE